MSNEEFREMLEKLRREEEEVFCDLQIPEPWKRADDEAENKPKSTAAEMKGGAAEVGRIISREYKCQKCGKKYQTQWRTIRELHYLPHAECQTADSPRKLRSMTAMFILRNYGVEIVEEAIANVFATPRAVAFALMVDAMHAAQWWDEMGTEGLSLIANGAPQRKTLDSAWLLLGFPRELVHECGDALSIRFLKCKTVEDICRYFDIIEAEARDCF